MSPSTAKVLEQANHLSSFSHIRNQPWSVCPQKLTYLTALNDLHPNDTEAKNSEHQFFYLNFELKGSYKIKLSIKLHESED